MLQAPRHHVPSRLPYVGGGLCAWGDVQVGSRWVWTLGPCHSSWVWDWSRSRLAQLTGTLDLVHNTVGPADPQVSCLAWQALGFLTGDLGGGVSGLQFGQNCLSCPLHDSDTDSSPLAVPVDGYLELAGQFRPWSGGDEESGGVASSPVPGHFLPHLVLPSLLPVQVVWPDGSVGSHSQTSLGSSCRL